MLYREPYPMGGSDPDPDPRDRAGLQAKKLLNLPAPRSWRPRLKNGLQAKLRQILPIGTRTLLFGGHQFILHPAFVLAAWIRIYRRLPSFLEVICIGIHDWGYWGKADIDGEEGEDHPGWAARAIWFFTGSRDLYDLCFYHSRTQAAKDGRDPSRLSLPDKYSFALMPLWLLVLLVKITGEIREYQANGKYSDVNKYVGKISDTEYMRKVKKSCADLILEDTNAEA